MGNHTPKLLAINRIDDGCIYILRSLDLKKHSLATEGWRTYSYFIVY